jgi:DcuC family C4-dicarboxylate transporter
MKAFTLRGRPSAVAALRPVLVAVLVALGAASAAAAPGPAPAAGDPASRSRVVVACVDLILVTSLVSLGFDVRMVLLLGAIPLFVAKTGLPTMMTKVVLEMTNPRTVVPIGAAMGFAFVLRITECDRHLVQLLLIPLRRCRLILIPGGIAAGYLINTTIVSQAGTASVLGPILIPLLRSGGLGSARAGAVLLLGSSMGGELFNSGAVEMQKLAELTGLTGGQLIARSAGLNLLACSTALCVFWLTALRRQRRQPDCVSEQTPTPSEPEAPPFRVNPIKAIVPVVPLAMLLIDFLAGASSPLRSFEGPAKILTAMLIGVVAAGLTSPWSTGGLAPAFFEGAGYAYHHVISLIVAASTFAEGVRLSGLIELVIRSIRPWPNLATVVAMTAPWCLAVVSGTGIAPAVAVMEFFVPAAGSMGLDPSRLGTVAALGAHFGRTMSPAAAVVMVSASLAQARASHLIREVAPALLVGGLVLLAAAILGFP